LGARPLHQLSVSKRFVFKGLASCILEISIGDMELGFMTILIRLEIPKFIKSLSGIIVQRNVVGDFDGVT
jgi:hypothetical protein